MKENIEIIYNDDSIVVCIKPTGVVSENGNSENPGMPVLLSKQLGCEVYPVHRLDKAVGGLMVFAKNSKSAASLSKQIADHTFEKCYYALVYGEAEKSGVFEDLLFKDVRTNKTFVVKRERKGVKKAKLSFEKVGSSVMGGKAVSLVRVKLYTGRSHQIRVQFASRKLPLVGDRRYGAKDTSKEIELYSCFLSFKHPVTGETMCFESLPGKNLFMHALLV